jgi:parallel beta-helix repeat protein
MLHISPGGILYMKKFKKIFVLFLVLILCLTTVVSINADQTYFIRTSNVDRNILYVGGIGPGNYTRIQYAIDNASENDMIFVFEGTYNENVEVDVSIDLIGENKENTIITALSDNVITITEDNVSINYFTIQYDNKDSKIDDAGIIMLNTHGVVVDNVTIVGPHYGIYMLQTEFCYVTDTIIYDCNFGISLQGAFYCEINGNNKIFNNKDGVFIEEGSHVYIINKNEIFSNSRSGIVTEEGWLVTIENNTIYDNNYSGIMGRDIDSRFIIKNNMIFNNYLTGIEIRGNLNEIISNTIYNNTLEGINLLGAIESIIKSNIIYSNRLGIFSDEPQLINISNNHIYENRECGIWLQNAQDDAVIWGNDISNNIIGINWLGNEQRSKTESNGCIIGKNEVQDNSDMGLNLNQQSNLRIIKNIFEGNRIGINISESNECKIEYNDIKNSLLYEIQIEKSLFLRLYHNNIMNSNNSISDYLLIQGFSIVWAPTNYWNIDPTSHPRSRLVWYEVFYPFIIFIPRYRGNTPLNN